MTPPLACVVRGCTAERAKDSTRCDLHRWEQWTGTPAWVARARAKALPAKELAA